MKTDKQYLKEGKKAIKKNNQNNLLRLVESTIKTSRDSITHKKSIENYKKLSNTLVRAIGTSPKDALKFLNNNQYLSQATFFVANYLKENPKEAESWIDDLESELSLDFSKLGFTKQTYDNAMFALQTNGFVGTPGALNVLVSTIMGNLRPIADEFLENHGYEDIAGMDIEDIAEILSQIGINPEGITKSYETNGFGYENKGVLKYLVDNAITNGLPMLEPLLEQAKEEGFEHNLTTAQLIKAYQQNGLFAKRGFFETILGEALSNKLVSVMIYKQIISQSLSEQKTEMKKLLDINNPLADPEQIATYANQKVEEMTITLLQQGGLLESLDDTPLGKVYAAHGLFSEEGVFAYLSESLNSTFDLAKEHELLTEERIKGVHSLLEGFSKSNSMLDIVYRKNKRSKLDEYSISVAKKADELGVSPLEFLEDEKYALDRLSLGTVVNPGITIKFKDDDKNHISGAVEQLEKVLEVVQDTDMDADRLKRELYYGCPDYKILESAVEAFGDRYIDDTFTERIADYLILTINMMNAFEKEQNKMTDLYNDKPKAEN